MQTRILKSNQIREAAEVLRNGGLVAFPTETVYGLGANALDPKAVRKVYLAKGRPADNPMIVHIAELEQVGDVAEKIPSKAKKLMERFWPGPLTVILEKNDSVPCEVTGGLKTVAVRLPKNRTARRLIAECSFPIAAPSANRSGRPSPTMAKHVIEDLYGSIDAIIDGGEAIHGLESTVVDMTVEPPAILRPGAVTKRQIENTIGALGSQGNSNAPKSPGMKYRHYSPNAKVVLAKTEEIGDAVKKLMAKHKVVGLMANARAGNPDIFIRMGGTKAEIARKLYGNLRLFDAKNADAIVVEEVNEKGKGHAIMNRLRRAAR